MVDNAIKGDHTRVKANTTTLLDINALVLLIETVLLD